MAQRETTLRERLAQTLAGSGRTVTAELLDKLELALAEGAIVTHINDDGQLIDLSSQPPPSAPRLGAEDLAALRHMAKSGQANGHHVGIGAATLQMLLDELAAAQTAYSQLWSTIDGVLHQLHEGEASDLLSGAIRCSSANWPDAKRDLRFCRDQLDQARGTAAEPPYMPRWVVEGTIDGAYDLQDGSGVGRTEIAYRGEFSAPDPSQAHRAASAWIIKHDPTAVWVGTPTVKIAAGG